MSTINEQPTTDGIMLTSPNILWQKRFYFVLTILGWLTFAAVIIWGISLIITPLVLFGFSALLAYLIFPMVRFFSRRMPRVLAILSSILLLLVVMGFVIFFIVAAAVQQFALLISLIQKAFQHPERYPQFLAIQNELGKLGISRDQFHISGQQLTSLLQKAIGGIAPVLGSIFFMVISLLLIATLAVYFMIDGERINSWLRHKTPLKYRGFINAFMDELGHSLGGYVRGQVLMAAIMTVIVGIGAFIIGVPYVFLLALIVFICEFIPQIGAYISGAVGVLFALTHSWQVALIYLVYVTVMQAGLDGQILSPRVLGHSVGLHPIISVFALLVGTVLFGLLGAFFACPVAGIIQAFVRDYWRTWRERHPDQFPTAEPEQKPVEVAGHDAHDQPVVST